MSKKWIAFFSQTGAEIVEVSRRLGHVPDLIVTNKDFTKEPPCNAFTDMTTNHLIAVEHLTKKPQLQEYEDVVQRHKSLFDNCVITLHGYLRIIPAELCNQFCILNSHPGDIVNHPELRGFNPQEKAFNLELESTGVTLHKVVPEVDAGPIISLRTASIKDLTLDEVYKNLHDISIAQWCDVLKDYIGD